MHTLVLSASHKETLAFAEAEGLSPAQVRFARSAPAVDASLFGAVVVLPSFAERRDRHAVMAAVKRMMRRSRKIELTERPDWTMPTPPPEPVAGELPGQMTIDDELARLANAPVEAKAPKDPEPKPRAKPKTKRRPVRRPHEESNAKPTASNVLEPAAGEVFLSAEAAADIFFGRAEPKPSDWFRSED